MTPSPAPVAFAAAFIAGPALVMAAWFFVKFVADHLDEWTRSVREFDTFRARLRAVVSREGEG